MGINDYYDQYTPIDSGDYLDRFKKYGIEAQPEAIQSQEVVAPEIKIPTVLDSTPKDLSQGVGEAQDAASAQAQAVQDETMHQEGAVRNQVGHENEANKRDNAANIALKKAYGPDAITADQSTKAGLLALIPQIGGMLAGAFMGSAKLSPHANYTLDQLRNNQTGIAGGIQDGTKVGEALSSEYLAKLQASADRQNKLNSVLASNDFKRAEDERGVANKLEEGVVNHGYKMEEEHQKLVDEASKKTGEEVSQNQKQTYVDMLTKRMEGNPKFTDQDKADMAASVFAVKTQDQLHKAFRDNLAIVDGAAGKPIDKLAEEDRLRHTLNSGKAYEDALAMNTIYEKAKSAVSRNDQPSAIAMFEAFAKSQNPQGSMREFAAQMAKDSLGPQQKAWGELAKIKGDGQIPKESMDLMFQVIEHARDATVDTYKMATSGAVQAARDRKIDLSHIGNGIVNLNAAPVATDYPDWQSYLKAKQQFEASNPQ